MTPMNFHIILCALLSAWTKDAIKAKEFKKLFGSVISANKQEKVIDDFIRHYFEEIIRRRARLPEPRREYIGKIWRERDLRKYFPWMLFPGL